MQPAGDETAAAHSPTAAPANQSVSLYWSITFQVERNSMLNWLGD